MAAKGKGKKKGGTGSKLNMRLTLILFALLPLLVSSVIIGIVVYKESAKEMKNATHNSLVQVVEGVGNSFDAMANTNKAILKAYTAAPIIQESLKDPENAVLHKKAQDFTADYFSKLNGWEGIYLADWNSKVLTHPNAGAVGMVLREGDGLTTLQNNILSAEDGVFNTGTMVSPASGQIIMSMYTPVIIDGEPKGFAGCGFYVSGIAESISDVSGLGLSSAYVYFVDNNGTMLFHPDSSD